MPWLSVIPVAFAGSVLFTALMIRFGARRGWVVVPRRDRWSKRTVAQFGGIPILLAFVTGALWFGSSPFVSLVVLLTVCAGILGLVDDLRGLSPLTKLLVEGALASAVIISGSVFPVSSHSWVNAAFTLFWIVGITNAVNLMDNMDGLAAGVAQVSLLATIVLSPAGQLTPALVAMFGALLGFLAFNFNPAKIFMGDVGSLAIGFLLACASTRLSESATSASAAFFVPLLLLFTPVFDTALVSVTRKLAGRRISLGGKDHLSHRMVFLGFTERQSVLTIYAVAGVAAVLAYFVHHYHNHYTSIGLVLFFAFVLSFWTYLSALRLPEDWLSSVRKQLSRTSVRAIIALRSVASDFALSFLGFLFAFTLWPVQLGGRFGSRIYVVTFAAAVLHIFFIAIFGAYSKLWRPARFVDLLPAALGSVAAALAFIFAVVALRVDFVTPNLLAGLACSLAFILLLRWSHSLFDLLFDKVTVPGSIGHSSSEIVALASHHAADQLSAHTPIVSFEHLRVLCEQNNVRRLELLPRCPHEEAGKLIEFCLENGIPVNSDSTPGRVSSGAY